jgi:uncharacterized membrane protein
MMTNIIKFLSDEIMVILIAAMPVLELRGAIPFGVSLGMHPLHAMVLGILGSMLPVPFLLLFLKPVFREMRKHRLFKKFVEWVTNRTMKKATNIKKYSALGLLIFVAVPLPTTGVWTGSIAAALLDMRFRTAFFAILAGNCIAALIMMILSHAAFGF